MTLRSLGSMIRRIRLKRHSRIAGRADACRFNHIEPCISDIFADKPEHRFPKKGWRLLVHIGYTGPTAKIDQMHDIELDEDILERIDFLACLFGTGKTG